MQDYYFLGQSAVHIGNVTPNSSVSSATTPNGTISTVNGVGGFNTQPPTPNSSNSNGCPSSMSEEHRLAFKQWHYCIQLGILMILTL